MRPCQRSVSAPARALALTLSLASLHVAPATAQDAQAAADEPRRGLELYCLEDGLAIDGYSPVSYFDKRKPEQGSPEFAVTHRGITYHLTDAKQVAKFQADPEKYEPAHGGWCSLMMSGSGNRVKANPRAWKIVGGKLLLFFLGDYQGKQVNGRTNWQRARGSERTRARQADQNWSQITAGKKQSKVVTIN